MGVRIHKFLGYGIADLATEKEKLVDPRINDESPIVCFEAPSTEDYTTWLADLEPDERGDLDFWFLTDKEAQTNGRGKRRISLDDCVAYSPEKGLAHVLALQPVSMKDWRRTDDPIDYIENHTLDSYSMEPKLDILTNGLYPWIGSYMDCRTGEKVNDKIMWWIRASQDDERRESADLDSLAEDAGFTSHNEALKYVAPFVPVDVRNLAKYLELFTNDNVWLDLRPMLYTYWS
jgi:hypothetical protein